MTVVSQDRRVFELFQTALESPLGERDDLLAASGEDLSIIAEAKALLAAHVDAQSSEFLATPALELFEQKVSQAGQVFGQYRIDSEIGEGGMGAVYLAGRSDGEFRSKVAIKLLKGGFTSADMIRRFRNERQMLAALEHPNIGRLIDGGTSENDLPYLIMEYVDGFPIDQYCSQNELSVDQKLALFLKICSAVSHAHRNLIIHRDLKPSNILVTAEGEPKLLDFGIAKLFVSEPSGIETLTNFRAFTPEYASPEQLKGEKLTTATDIYSLGVILYEMMAGVRPFRTKGKNFAEVLHLVSEVEPSRPSETARTGGADDVKIRASDIRSLRGDLDNIVLKAIKKEPGRRYGTVDDLAEDIRRYQAGQTVSARPDTLGYRAQKFVHRNKLLVAFAGMLLLSLAVGMIATVSKSVEARRERELAERRFDSLRKLSDSFTTELHSAIQNLPGSLPARQLLLKRAIEQLDALATESGDDRGLKDELAQAYSHLASLPDMPLSEKESTDKKVIAIYIELLKDDPGNAGYKEKLAIAYTEFADTNKVRGSVAAGFESCRSAVSILEDLVTADPSDPSHLKNLQSATADLANFFLLEGRYADALDAARRGLALIDKLRPTLSPTEAAGLDNRSHLQLGSVLTALGDYATAGSEIQMALDGFNREQSADPNDTSINYSLWAANKRMAMLDYVSGDTRKAVDFAERSRSIIEALLSTSPKDRGYYRNTALTLNLLGSILRQDQKDTRPETLFRRALDLSEQVLKDDPEYFESKVDVARSHAYLGSSMARSGAKELAIAHLEDSVRLYASAIEVDSENALLKRDYAEACDWLAAAIEKTDASRAAELKLRSISLWNDLKLQNKLTYSDRTIR